MTLTLVLLLAMYFVGLVTIPIIWLSEASWQTKRDYPIAKRIILLTIWPIPMTITIIKFLFNELIIPLYIEFETGKWWSVKEKCKWVKFGFCRNKKYKCFKICDIDKCTEEDKYQ